MKTKFANGVNPFTGKEEMSICNDPLPAHRAKQGSKYDDILKCLKPGLAVKCNPASVDKLSNAVKKYAKRNFPGSVVRSTKDYGDGMGRVWVLKP